ncbi:hypothetical protein B0E53_07063 [Micromonospora sp. MH33]|nr:hypothetical protein B0E53_07063 [Micromonospora sp. MH33]
MPGRRLLAAAVAVLLALTGCGSPRADGRATGPGGEAELRYGAAPAPGDGVTLQPDVVIVGQGGRSVRSVSADGLIWRLDAAARNTDRLARGVVMFVTGRGVGRVLDLAEEGSDLLVTIGPVDITEVVRDGSFASRGLTLDDPVVYPAGEPSWAQETRRSSLLNSLTGVPVGVMGLLIRHGVRFTVGISAFLFTAGVYFELTTSYGSTLGSALGAAYAQCRGVGIGVRARFGVGYRILEPVVQVINKFLSLLTPSRGPRIPPVAAAAGPSWSSDVYRNEEVIPDVAVCGHAPR